MRDFLDIIIAKLAIWSIKRGYGGCCEPEDYVEECAECRAGEAIRWLEDHIRLIKA